MAGEWGQDRSMHEVFEGDRRDKQAASVGQR
jgi:hypothetical protein